MRLLKILLAAPLLLSSCAIGCNGHEPSTQSPQVKARAVVAKAAPGERASVLIPDVPHQVQKPDFCGEAVASMYLRALGKSYDQGDVFAMSGMDPARGMGVTTRELKAALGRIGFDVGDVWFSIEAEHADRELAALFDDLYTDLIRGVPSIVCTHYDDSPNTTEHFRLVLGYDADKDEIIYHEPAVKNGSYRRMKRADFLKLWPLEYARDEWTVIRFALDPSDLQDPPAHQGHGPAAFAQHVMQLRKRLPRGFSVVVEPPFVVVGDGGPQAVKSAAARTVRWSVERLKKDYFAKDPNEILDIWLFKDEKSYRKHTYEIFGDRPDTPYGYYSSSEKALVMNIATGGGTLVHEIVHPFVEANFPECPAWFNEGLGSLYEQSSTRDGHIIGLTNWRLAGLQDALRSGGVPTFAALTSTTTHEFYEEDAGTNYAQARYLLYYLQERGLLVRYYRQFHANQDKDPTGYESLKKILGLTQRDMPAFERDWASWVLRLRFP